MATKNKMIKIASLFLAMLIVSITYVTAVSATADSAKIDKNPYYCVPDSKNPNKVYIVNSLTQGKSLTQATAASSGSYFTIGSSAITVHLSSDDCNHILAQQTYVLTAIFSYLIYKQPQLGLVLTVMVCATGFLLTECYYHNKNSDGSLDFKAYYVDLVAGCVSHFWTYYIGGHKITFYN